MDDGELDGGVSPNAHEPVAAMLGRFAVSDEFTTGEGGAGVYATRTIARICEN
jgi:hypothetical protein